MFCSNCGHPANAGAKFCSQCGRAFSGAPAAPPAAPKLWPLPVAIHLNVTLLKTAPYILWLDRQRCGLIQVDPGAYQQITGSFPRAREKAQAFREYAAGLLTEPLEAHLAACPGSMVFDTAQIQKMHLEKYYDADRHQYMDYERFSLVTAAGKHRGALERDTSLSILEPALRELLGYRFSTHETVQSFDHD
jgi:hypothetical protein